MKLSIVTTLYRSEDYIVEFCERASESAKELVGDQYEIIMVNDGSPDKSLDIAVRLSEMDSHVVVVDLSRNFGHHKAMMTGLGYAKGEKIFLIDVDLEEEPEWLHHFDEQMKSEKSDVVYGVQEKRKGRSFERYSGECFYWIFNKLAGLSLPGNIVTARLMTRRYVDSLLLHKERELMIAGIWANTGFLQTPRVVKKHNTSDTSYSLGKKIDLFINSIVSFSNKPLYFIFYAGMAVSVIACIYCSYLLIHYFFLATPLGGWTSVVASIWLLGGMTMSFIGIVAIYVSKIFLEAKQRPYTIVRDVYGQSRENCKG